MKPIFSKYVHKFANGLLCTLEIELDLDKDLLDFKAKWNEEPTSLQWAAIDSEYTTWREYLVDDFYEQLPDEAKPFFVKLLILKVYSKGSKK